MEQTVQKVTEFKNKGQAARQILENLRTRTDRKRLENQNQEQIAQNRKTELERKEQAARTRLKETRVCENKNQNARKRLGNLLTRSKPLERD